ncbi:MAG: hypothetical protein E7284_07480 [Lachnospiraceae bacterium]|nr:hypothetical protein [Lachnospiraceae bacterium]
MKNFSPERLEYLLSNMPTDMSLFEQRIKEIGLFDYDGIYATDISAGMLRYAREAEERNQYAADKLRIAFENVWEAEEAGVVKLREIRKQLGEYTKYIYGLAESLEISKCGSEQYINHLINELYAFNVGLLKANYRDNSNEDINNGITVSNKTLLTSEDYPSIINELIIMSNNGWLSKEEQKMLLLAIIAYAHASDDEKIEILVKLNKKYEQIILGRDMKACITQSGNAYSHDIIQLYNDGYLTKEDYNYFLQCIKEYKNASDEEKEMILKKILQKYEEIKLQYTFKAYLKEAGITDPEEWQRMYETILKLNPSLLYNLRNVEKYGSNSDTLAYVKQMISYYENNKKLYITKEDVKTLCFLDENGTYYYLDEQQQEVFIELWYTLVSMGLTYEQIVGVLANIYEESKFSCYNRQDTKNDADLYDYDYEYKTDDEVGYGLLQWTHYSRKEKLEAKAIEMNGQVSDLDVQIEYFKDEMSGEFKSKWCELMQKDTIYDVTEYFMENIEKPEIENIEDRMRYANSIDEWHQREVMK